MTASEDFFRAYVACALWSSTDESDESGGEPLDKNYGYEDIAPETLARMRADCDTFFVNNAADLALYVDAMSRRAEWTNTARAGHDFWLTRNGHGVGFWDRGLGELGERLSRACYPFGSFDLYIGDDGRVHG